MRIAINLSVLIMIFSLIIVVHSCILNKHLRDMEISSGLESSTDYAIDVMGNIYSQIGYDKAKEDEYINKLMTKFCESLSEMIGSDGEVTVRLKEADLEKGLFGIVVEESFCYGFMGLAGKSVCERVVVFE